MRLARRQWLAGAGAALAAACVPLDQSTAGRLAAKLRLIEVGLGGTLGVSLLDSRDGATLGYNDSLRFPMASTFKCSLAALVLALDQDGRLDASQRITWSEKDLLAYAPFAKEKLASGATILELARAAQVLSDNTAANLLLARVGGPQALTAFWRSIGDETSRLDRMETELNFVPEGELRDTTTPAAMARTLRTLLYNPAPTPLKPERQARLRQWMAETTTGLTKVRAAFPRGTEVGDKTGNSGQWPGMGQLRGDIGYAVPGDGSPILFAVYHSAPIESPPDGALVDAAFVEVGRILAQWSADRHAIVPA